MSPPAIVIGGGHNGLVAALRLARGGRRVTVLERRDRLGGLAAGEEFHPGYRSPGVLLDTAGLRPRVVAALGLERHGLRWRERPPVVVARPGREALEPAAGNGLAGWRRSIDELRPFVTRLQERPPPRFELRTAGDLLRLGLDGLALRRLGRRRSRELLRILPMPAADWLAEWIEDSGLAGALAAPALFGVAAGPRSPGTAGGLLLAKSGRGREVAGGPAALVAALAGAARAAGIELRTDAEVRVIEVDDGRVAGVRLDSGEELDTAVVAASCDPKTTLLRLLPPGSLGLRDERAARSFRCQGTVARLDLALAGAPALAGAGEATPELVRMGDLEELERAFDAAKYGLLPEAPTLELRLPTVSDPELAPPGHHVGSVLVGCVPHTPRGGWTPELRQRLTTTVMERLEAAAPGIGELVVGAELLTPREIEERHGVAGGHLYHGEMTLDQLLSLRPAAFAGRYRTPIEGLWLAGGGSHPGGGISGLPGWLAAGAILGR